MKKKKNPRKLNRIFAVFLAVLVLATVAVVPALAVVGQDICPTDGAVNIRSETTGRTDGRQVLDEFRTRNLKNTATNPYTWTFTNILLGVTNDSDWSYVSFELCYNEGHYSIGFYRNRDCSDTQIRMGNYTYTDTDYDDWQVEKSIASGVGEYCVSYTLTDVPGNQYHVITMDFYFIDRQNNIVQHETVSYKFAGYPDDYMEIAVKTQDATVYCDAIRPDNEVPHTVPELVQYEKLDVERDGQVAEAYGQGFNKANENGEVVVQGIWDVLSMPVNLLGGILNFDLFGINVWAIATSLITLGLIVFVLKKVGVF